MKKNLQRLSQLASTFGPGAMVDLPTRSVLINGLEFWETYGDGFKPIQEPRLIEKLERRLKDTHRLDPGKTLTLRMPPPATSDFNKMPKGVEATIFPTWFVCDAEAAEGGKSETRRRRLVKWNQLDPAGGKLKFQPETGKKVSVTPIRFVAGCEKGHLQDVEWRWVVHGATKCQEPMWLEERGTSADPRDTRVVCGCGSALSLEEAFRPKRFGRCAGERPWLRDRDPAGCTNDLRFLIRTATNTYFPQVATVISLPSEIDELAKRVQANLDDLKAATSPAEVAMGRKFNKALAAALEGFSDDEVFARLKLLLAQTRMDASLPVKLAEFEVFASGAPVIGVNQPDALLFAQTLDRGQWDPRNEPLLSGIESLVVVHRLREVSCLYGFTRFEAAATEADGDLEDIRLAVDGAPLGRETDWLPAVEQFGEGLFIHFSQEAIADWLVKQAVKDRALDLLDGFDRWKTQRPSGMSYPGAAYVMLHSLSHALMAEIALDCGYPASALKERVYAVDDPLQAGKPTRFGILIYTATTGAQGTLGGLVATTPRFGQILGSALRRLSVCSSDPICSDHEPATSSDDRALHGAACHGCLLIAETSCEARNLFLDRGLLVETMADTKAGFFG
jgi:hypothetical protein